MGLFKPHEYGKVILPMTVLKPFDDAIAPTKQAVLEMKKKLDASKCFVKRRKNIGNNHVDIDDKQ